MIHVGDNSWNIRVLITDLQVEKTVRVKGDLHIGGVMLKLSKTEGELSTSLLRVDSYYRRCRHVVESPFHFVISRQEPHLAPPHHRDP